MIAWVVVSMVQVLLLPGFVATLAVRDLEWPDRLLLAPPVSLIVNYFVVLLLVVTQAYTRPALLACIAAELLALGLLIRRRRQDARADGSRRAKADPAPLSRIDAAIVALAAASLLPCVYVAYGQLGTIFTFWDAVVSWNRWAAVWFQGVVPPGTFTYPQAVPILYSVIYEFVDDNTLQFFPKTLSMVYPFVAIATLARIAWIRPSSRRAVLLSIPVFVWFSGHQYWGLVFLFSGYVDTVIAYFGILAVYLFALLHRRHEGDRAGFWDDPLLYLALLIVAGAALVKQTGGFLAVLFPLALYWYLGRNGVAFWRMRKVRAYASLYVFIVAHWYVFKFVQFHLGRDSALAAGYLALIPGPALLRPAHGLRMFFDAVGWWFAPPFVLGLLDPIARRIALWFVLPLFLIWAFTVSYDLRGLFIAVPWIAIVCGAGIALAIRWAAVSPVAAFAGIAWLAALAFQVTRKAPAMMQAVDYAIPVGFYYALLMGLIVAAAGGRAIARWGTGRLVRSALLYLAIVSGCLLIAEYSSREYSTQLRGASMAQRLRLGDAQVNAYLRRYFANRPSSRGDVATSYQFMNYVPGLESHFRLARCGGDLDVYRNPAVHYVLTSTACTPAVNRSIVEHLTDARKLASINGYEFYKLHAAGEAPSAEEAASLPSLAEEASSAAPDDRTIVANDYSDAVWTHGVGTQPGLRDMFFFITDSAGLSRVKVGTRLDFGGSGSALVKEVAPVAQGGRYSVFVRVDQELDPVGDGFPNSITIERPSVVMELARRHKWIAAAMALALALLVALMTGLLPHRPRMSAKTA